MGQDQQRTLLPGFLTAYIFSCQKVSMDSGFSHPRSLHIIKQEGNGACLQKRGLQSQQNKETQEPLELLLLLAGNFCKMFLFQHCSGKELSSDQNATP